MVSRIALGLPGRFRMSVLPRRPAVCRDSTAVGTCLPVPGPLSLRALPTHCITGEIPLPSVLTPGF